MSIPADLPDDVVLPAEPTELPARGEIVELEAKVKQEGMRLDHYLTLHLGSDYSRSEIKRTIDAGEVWVNDRETKASYKVRPGDRLRVKLPVGTFDRPVPEDIPLDILYEDEHLALVNKPAGMVVHPAKGNWTGTLVNALHFHFAELSQANGAYRAGIVHRLDRETSGVILIAKDEITHRDLALAFEQRKVFKEYLAITHGRIDRDSDYVELAIKHHPHVREKMVTVTGDDPDAKSACSFYEVIERFPEHTFCRVQPRTGRTHQIRVHLLSIGCPVLADKLYSGGSRVSRPDLLGEPGLAGEPLLERQALHAHRLRFRHPRKGTWLEGMAPLPPDMQATLDVLHEAPKR